MEDGVFWSLLVAVFLLCQVVQWVALLDAARRPEADLSGSGGKTLWVLLLAAAFVIPGGVLLALVYLYAIRRRVITRSPG